MTRADFLELLNAATTHALEFARSYVENDLPEAVRYHVLLNQSNDDHATNDERVYPEDEGRYFASLCADEVAELLVRDGRCPEWIDIGAEAEGRNYTLIRLVCCGRYTDDKLKMYYTHIGTGPFGVKSPTLPPGYGEGTKFRLATIPI